jgi:hypothetical protein
MENTIPSITQRSILYMAIHAEIFMATCPRQTEHMEKARLLAYNSSPGR